MARLCLLVLLGYYCISTSRAQVGTSSIGDKKVVCYYLASSHSRKAPYGFGPEQIDPLLCTHLIYAFADIGPKNDLISSDPEFDLLNRAYDDFRILKYKNGQLKVMLSIGGWVAGSLGFARISATEANRTAFAKSALRFLRAYRFDGLDLHWQHPGFREGGTPQDIENYVLLAQALRLEFETETILNRGSSKLLLSMAITHNRKFLQNYDLYNLNYYIDFISVLSYDYHFSFEAVANHHAPLYSVADLNGNENDAEGNAKFTINYFAKVIPKVKIVMGIPLYGRTFKLYNPEETALGSDSDGAGDKCPTTDSKGLCAYFEICMQLKTDNWTIVQPKPGAVGPYAYKGDQWVGYDDIQMVKNKAAYAVEQGLGGVMFWTVDYDDFLGSCGQGTKFPMINAARNEISKIQTFPKDAPETPLLVKKQPDPETMPINPTPPGQTGRILFYYMYVMAAISPEPKQQHNGKQKSFLLLYVNGRIFIRAQPKDKLNAEQSETDRMFNTEVDNNPPNVIETYKTSYSRTECLLPEEPGNRLYCPYQCPKCSLNPYSSCTYPSRTQSVQAIRVQCLPGYGLDTGQDHVVSACIDKTWVPSVPDCQKVCPPLESEFLDITCFNEFTEVDCRRPMRPGVWATYKCKPSHREFPNLASAGIYSRTLVCKNGGHWSNYLPECVPICGLSRGNDSLTPNIVNGTATKLGQFPWHTALYKRNSFNNEVWDNICGGSLINHYVVLTAAHCVAGVITTTADLRVALGKYFRDWDKDELDTIKRDIISIKLPPEYKGGATSYAWDMALLLMNDSVQFNSFVMPVCMNLGSDKPLTNGDITYVVGWGETRLEGGESETLLFNTITIMAENDCQRSIALFLSFDKFCGIKSDVSVVQPGDSGGGLTAIVGGLHYIFGVVSTKFKEVPIFTNISWYTHKTWIDREIINIIN